MPKWGQARIRNVLHNLERPRDFVNSLLQAKPGRAGRHLGSFLIDSTVGIAGAYEISRQALGNEPPETTGETLGVYRLPAGAYLVLPLYGETCPRCLVGSVGDALLHPLFWVSRENGVAVSAGVQGLAGLNALARQMPAPRAEAPAWERYEALLRERPSYEEAKELFRENLELDVAE